MGSWFAKMTSYCTPRVHQHAGSHTRDRGHADNSYVTHGQSPRYTPPIYRVHRSAAHHGRAGGRERAALCVWKQQSVERLEGCQMRQVMRL